MTFAQRIEIGQVFQNTGLDELAKFKRVMACLEQSTDVNRYNIEYWFEVIEGLKYWLEREAKELKYKPSADEIAAGADILALQVAEMSTIVSLAESFGRDPDEILTWKYGKVFNILFTNLQKFLFKQRLDKRIAEKYKRQVKQR